MSRVGLAGALAVMVTVAPAAASTFFPQTVKCPVGGKSFTHMAYGSYSRWGELPDGQPVGSAQYPLEIPQCPDNGLVLYDEFDKATAARLTPIVRGAEYQALRQSETRYYLAWWLRGKLGETGIGPIWTLLAATWEAKNGGDAARTARYADTFIAQVRALPAGPTSLEWAVLRARAANALRELGRYDEAEALRASVPMMDLPGDDDETRKNREGWRGYLEQLRVAIARRDTARAPIDMIGQREAVFRCVEPERQPGAPPLSAFEKDYCAKPDVAEAVGKQRELIKSLKPL